MVPKAASVPVPMSCSDIGWITGWSAPPCATMIPLRAWSSGSKPGVSARGPFAPPLDVGVHEPRVAGAEAVEIEAQVARHLARHVLDQRVGAVHERGERLAASCVLEVETDLVLVAVQRRVRRRGHGAELLTPGRVDLHHARPEVLQHQAPERTGEELGGVDDQHPVERQH